jgi:acyl carrier protein
MTDEEILQKLQEILRTHINVTTSVLESTALIGDGVVDSLDFMNYVTRVEETFDIQISNDDLANHQLGIMRNMVAYLRQRCP